MKILVTGANGFVGRNLCVRLRELSDAEVVPFTRGSDERELSAALREVDFVYHLAGVNRPTDPGDFFRGNVELTEQLARQIRQLRRPVPVVYTSSAQAVLDVPYGRSKLAAEQALQALANDTSSPVYICRLPNVFGKWCRPNYNSAVATFCHNIARDLPVQINDPSAVVRLVYIDDVIEHFMRLLRTMPSCSSFDDVPVYSVTVGDLVEQIQRFKNSRTTHLVERVGIGLTRALYATYVSYLEPPTCTYYLTKHRDDRGDFVEMLKTHDSGQFSYFTAKPGTTRGGHYHHSKTEKFLVIRGRARFRFVRVDTGERFELLTSETPQIVETIPGWAHDITNVGSDEMIVMLWANEIFDREHPDTVGYPCED